MGSLNVGRKTSLLSEVLNVLQSNLSFWQRRRIILSFIHIGSELISEVAEASDCFQKKSHKPNFPRWFERLLFRFVKCLMLIAWLASANCDSGHSFIIIFGFERHLRSCLVVVITLEWLIWYKYCGSRVRSVRSWSQGMVLINVQHDWNLIIYLCCHCDCVRWCWSMKNVHGEFR
jgi:hypothetical protein